MTRADAIVVALAAALVGGLFAAYWQIPQTEAEFEVRSGRAVVARYSLHEDRTFAVAGALGDSVLKVEGNRVRFVSSPCRNKVCIHSGWHSHRGDAAACLPNRVSLSLLGGAQGRFDAVSH
jgi:hypothetical protein